MITKIRKRSGEVVAFDSKKIEDAIHKANVAVSDEKISMKTVSYTHLTLPTTHIV